ncbi:hypothetical protein [Comamonas sp. AG1104]|uniref:hypothetical protein n=1 Tax=Comamonas sp. AG1104 TaxID=2183900 RepID=UPI0011C03221|nr:hypothetical protein [Comamonas sp. AG1104]
MANSIYVALKKIPSGLSDVEKIISSAFSEFGFENPLIKFNRNLHDEDLLKDFLQIEGKKEENQCWISFDECIEDIYECENCKYIINIQTRGNWYFAGIVAYAFCKFSGNIVLNDAAELDGRLSYNLEDLKLILKNYWADRFQS